MLPTTQNDIRKSRVVQILQKQHSVSAIPCKQVTYIVVHSSDFLDRSFIKRYIALSHRVIYDILSSCVFDSLAISSSAVLLQNGNCQPISCLIKFQDRLCSVMVSVLDSSAEGREFDPQPGQNKDVKNNYFLVCTASLLSPQH